MYKWYRNGIYDTLRTLKWNQVKLKCTVTKKLKIQNVENIIFRYETQFLKMRIESSSPFYVEYLANFLFFIFFDLFKKIFWTNDILILSEMISFFRNSNSFSFLYIHVNLILNRIFQKTKLRIKKKRTHLESVRIYKTT